jgi:hypothetical protein
MSKAFICGLFLVGAAACGESKPSAGEALAKAMAPPAKSEVEAVPESPSAPPKPALGPGEVGPPWKIDAIRSELETGVRLTYKVTGKNSKGKPVDDNYIAEIRRASDKDVAVLEHLEHETDPAAKQVATYDWTTLGPFFAVDKPQSNPTERTSIAVPAGTFDVVVTEVKGFFGAKRTLWMIVDKPGVYAKVVDHGNEQDDSDKTELTYELVEIGK